MDSLHIEFEKVIHFTQLIREINDKFVELRKFAKPNDLYFWNTRIDFCESIPIDLMIEDEDLSKDMLEKHQKWNEQRIKLGKELQLVEEEFFQHLKDYGWKNSHLGCWF